MNLPDLPYRKFAKTAVNVIVGAGTSKIVKGIIENNTMPENAKDKAAILAATFVVGSMVSEATSKHTGAKIDALADWWTTNVSSKFKDEEEIPEEKELETPAVEVTA